jgi:hypothetical protein
LCQGLLELGLVQNLLLLVGIDLSRSNQVVEALVGVFGENAINLRGMGLCTKPLVYYLENGAIDSQSSCSHCGCSWVGVSGGQLHETFPFKGTGSRNKGSLVELLNVRAFV